MIPVTLADQTHYRGSVWKDGYRHFGPMTNDAGQPPGPPILSCRIQYRNGKTDALGYELNSVAATGKGSITIIDGVHYEFSIPEQPLPLDTGRWLWDFETFVTTDCSGPSETWVSGTMIVIKDVSHD